ncbi:hypothetical protein CDL60_14185 [Roseateles noduli]|nr:hypothetical protein CDL60_14185 [Roseateles noduli]
MNDVGRILEHLRASLCQSIEVGVMGARNQQAHKWKALWRALLLRETVAWRWIDLLSQSFELHSSGSVLGARILLRATYETLAVLIYVKPRDLDYSRLRLAIQACVRPFVRRESAS